MRVSPGRQWEVPRWQPKRYPERVRNIRVHGDACPTLFVEEPSWACAGPPGERYFEMFGGVIGAVARDWGEVVEA